MKNENEVCSLEKIKKVHINTNHKSDENLLHAYKKANILTYKVSKHTKKGCQKYKKNIRIKVTLKKFTDFNQVVTWDLKHFREKYVYGQLIVLLVS